MTVRLASVGKHPLTYPRYADISSGDRVQFAWAKSNHFRHVLTNKHISIKLRVRFLDSIISPRFFSASPQCHWRNPNWPVWTRYRGRCCDQWWAGFIFWRRTGVTLWFKCSTRCTNALKSYRMENWTKQLAIRQHNFAANFGKQPGWLRTVLAWCRQSNWQNNQATETKAWQTSQEMAGQIEQVLWKGFPSIRIMDKCSKKSWMVFPQRSAIILRFLCQ